MWICILGFLGGESKRKKGHKFRCIQTAVSFQEAEKENHTPNKIINITQKYETKLSDGAS